MANVIPGLGLMALAGMFAAFVVACSWSQEGPEQKRRRAILALTAGSIFVVITALGFTAGVLEGVNSTSATDSAEFGVGYEFAAIFLMAPVIQFDVALFGLAAKSGGEALSRGLASVFLSIFLGIPACIGFGLMVTSVSDAFHP